MYVQLSREKTSSLLTFIGVPGPSSDTWNTVATSVEGSAGQESSKMLLQ